MVTTLALPHVAKRAERSLSRATAVAGRNLTAARHAAYWWALFSGFFEPLLYLLSIGIGVGALVGDFALPNGRTVSYAAFVAPAMLAASAMNGALAESTFNFFAKLKWMRLYDAVLATPVKPMEIAIGELMWAMVRGMVYSVAFLAIMVGMHLTTFGWALAALPATLAVGFAFGALGMTIATLVRGWQDFDYVMVIMFALFLFSGTFTPAESYNIVLRVIVELTPLYHGVELIRGLTTGVVQSAMLWHLTYLALLTVGGLAVAGRRMNAVLRQ
jgi:lipooligosaccharide transport system permease protein